MKEEVYQNIFRAIWGVYLIALPMFLMSAVLIYAFEVNGVKNITSKADVVYLTVFFGPLLGVIFYLIDQHVQKRLLIISDTAIKFGRPDAFTVVLWKEIDCIYVDLKANTCWLDVKSKNNFERRYTLKFGHYDINKTHFVNMLTKLHEKFHFKLEL
ncbi:hypothetical protein [Colwellia sp. MEBiC06753]